MDKLADALNLEPIAVSNTTVISPSNIPAVVLPSIAQDDFDFARKNIKILVETGLVSLTELQSFANQTSTAHSYEVISALIKTLSDSNKDLLELSLRKKKLLEMSPDGNNPFNINNAAIFVGSTNELQKLLKKEGLLEITEAEFIEVKPPKVKPPSIE